MSNKVQRYPLRSRFINISESPKLSLDINVNDLTKSSFQDNSIKNLEEISEIDRFEMFKAPLEVNSEEHQQLHQNTHNLKKLFEFLVSITGFIVALLWLGGRSYAAGYFSSLNVPLYMLNFSVWEYGELYGAIFFLFLGLLVKEYIVIIVIALIVGTLIGLLAAIFFPKPKLDKLSIILQKFLTNGIWLVWVVLVLFVSIFFANEVGKRMGFQVAVSDSNAVAVTFNESIFLDNSIALAKVGQSTNTSLFQTTDLRLITYNSGKYYLYKNIDQFCKPEKVYIIDETKINSIYLTKGKPFDVPQCVQALNSPLSLNPMPTISIPTPTP